MMTTDLQSLANIATVVGAAAAALTAVALALAWLIRRRNQLRRRLSISIERPKNDEFYVVVRYRPENRSQAHFVDIGSLGSNPIYLLPRTHSEMHRRMIFDQFGTASWPKTGGQWTGGRLRPQPDSQSLSTRFQIVPETTDAAGWLHIRVYTKGPGKRTLVQQRIAVSLLA